MSSQLCGNSPPYSMASIYTLPISLSTSGSALPCSFSFSTDSTPMLTAVSAARLAVNATLTLTGTGFASGIGPPTVQVCGGRSCRVESHSATSITCTMPDCPEVASPSPVLVHVPPQGYASQSGSLVVGGVLSIVSIGGPAVGGAASGSAAGGVRLTIRGTGFPFDETLMRVTLRVSGGSAGIASCNVVASGLGLLECITSATSAPLSHAGTQVTVRVAVLASSGGNEVASASVADGYQLLAATESMTLTGLDVTAGSTAGGTSICVSGTNLDGGGVTPTVLLGTAPCLNATGSATQLCCIASAAPAGSTAITVQTPQLGVALATGSMPPFVYTTAPTVHSSSPSSGRAGSTITVAMDTPPSGSPTPAVTLGGYPCASVVAVDNGDGSTTLTCVAPNAPPGVHRVHVSIPSFGDAVGSGDLTFEIAIVITAVSPAVGSAGGGTLLTVSGFGFDHIGNETQDSSVSFVTIGGRPCTLASQTSTEITCRVPPIVEAMTGMQEWVNSFYPQPPVAPPPPAPPSPPPPSPPLPSLPPSPPPSPPPPSPPPSPPSPLPSPPLPPFAPPLPPLSPPPPPDLVLSIAGATMSSSDGNRYASHCVDGRTRHPSPFCATARQTNSPPWLSLELNARESVTMVEIYNTFYGNRKWNLGYHEVCAGAEPPSLLPLATRLTALPNRFLVPRHRSGLVMRPVRLAHPPCGVQH